MSVIHFVGGEKGGVGKSVVARVLSQYFLDNAVPFIGLDADQSHATLSRYYSDYTSGINLDHFESIDQIMELAQKVDCQILIDIPSQSQRFLDRWIEENGVIEMCEDMNIRLVYWYVVDDGPDSVDLLKDFLAKYNSEINVFVVKNQGCGSDFSDIETLLQSNVSAPNSKSVRQCYIPALHATTMHKIEKLGLSFWAAANLKNNTEKHLGLMERQRSKVWSNKVYQAIRHLLGGIEPQ